MRADRSEALGRRYEPMHLFFTALGGVILLFIIAPLAGMFLNCSGAELVETVQDAKVRSSIFLTLWTAMTGTLLCSVAGIPFAYLLARKKFPLKQLVIGIVDIPIVVPHSAAGIALFGILSKQGFFGGAAEKIGISFVNHPAGIIVAMSFVSVPFLIHASREAFSMVPRRIEKAAFNLGASPMRVFLTISVPLAWRGILSGLILMWARGMSEFGAVVIIAYHPMITPVQIYERFGAYGLRYARPVAVVFITICLIVFVVLRLLISRPTNAER